MNTVHIAAWNPDLADPSLHIHVAWSEVPLYTDGKNYDIKISCVMQCITSQSQGPFFEMTCACSPVVLVSIPMLLSQCTIDDFGLGMNSWWLPGTWSYVAFILILIDAIAQWDSVRHNIFWFSSFHLLCIWNLISFFQRSKMRRQADEQMSRLLTMARLNIFSTIADGMCLCTVFGNTCDALLKHRVAWRRKETTYFEYPLVNHVKHSSV